AHWHNLSKLSLETGDDVDVVAEGLACNIHTMSSGSQGYGYDAWRGNWITMRVQGVNRGVYLNIEQRNKLFLENRNWVEDPNNTWMYKITGENETLLKVPDKDSGEVPPDYPDSPARIALNYTPFMPSGSGSTPDDAGLVADMDDYVNMQGMLSMAAINSFISNHDSLFSHYQNTYFMDYNMHDPCETRKRMYLPWDVDSVMKGAEADGDIYDREGGSTTWQEIFLDSPTYRPQYNQVMSDLMGTSLTQSNINSFLDMMLPILQDALAADPYNQFATPGTAGVLERFSEIKTWYSNRIVNILEQIWWDEPAGTILLKDDFEGTPWNDNWTGAWLQNTEDYKSSYTSAHTEDGSEGDFTCGNLDASDANVIHVAFWIMKDDTENDDIDLYYYNGATDSYDYIIDLDTLGADDVWLRYTDTITDSNYFEPDFKIRFNATVGNNENVWVDDVIITKLISEPNEPVISGYILNPKNAGIGGVLMLADNGGGSVLTDGNGFYEFPVPYGWSGTITPTEADYTFVPSERTYSKPVVVDQPQRWSPDYNGTSIYDLDSNGSIDFYDYATFASAWQSSLVDGNWNPACDFYTDLTIDFRDLDKFTTAWLIQ
ncbi:MAG: CotH kinase family protein, partial [Planctomycetes bacterium]|nr:CotH kinase family protein [Planctomycetota bacterium]